MAQAEPDDETAQDGQVVGPAKSRVLSVLGPGLITGASQRDRHLLPGGRPIRLQHFLDDAL